MEATTKPRPRDDRRTGEIDSILFGRMLELLARAIEQRQELHERDAAIPRSVVHEANGRVLGIAQSCSLVSGIPVPVLIERMRDGARRSA